MSIPIITDQEFEEFLNATKVLEADVTWYWEDNRRGWAKFHRHVTWGHRMFDIRGTWNPKKEALSFHLFIPPGERSRKTQRIYGLDHGGDRHKNPDQTFVGSLHKHRWSERYRDKEAYVPDDILCPPTDVAGVWREFCAEAIIDHRGTFHLPPVIQHEL